MSQPFNRDYLYTSIILFAGALLISLSAALSRFDNVFYDAGRFLAYQSAPADVVIIAIDELSLKQLGKWPWSRKVHAQLLQKLSYERTKVIGIDILFSEPDKQHPEDDLALARAIQQAQNVVLPTVLEVPYQGAAIKKITPLSILTKTASSLGRVNVPLDQDGIARSIYSWEGVIDHNASKVNWLPLFAHSVLQVANLLPMQKASGGTEQLLYSADMIGHHIAHSAAERIPFLGPPGHFTHISYVDVLNGNYPPDFFNNKLVLVGATAVGMGDVLATPVSGFSKPMTGVEFHANVIQTLRHQKLIAENSQWLNASICALLSLVPMLWLSRCKPLISLSFIVVYLTILILLMMAMPSIFQRWIPPSSAFLMILLAYPIWSWRKLETAQIYLDKELEYLENDLAQIGYLPEVQNAHMQHDIFQSRISQVRRAADLLRDLQKDRNETLAFISHDIRTPLATALMLLKEPDVNHQRLSILAMLTRAHQLAENFLQVSKAEMANQSLFQEINVDGLIQEVVDDLYQIAQSNKIKLELHKPELDLWVNGDFGLLQRAISNLILNAIKASPEQEVVVIKAMQRANDLIIEITDVGSGIPADKIPLLFKRFSRIDQQKSSIEGSGLGLYFVDITIKKHQGTISVNSKIGQKTTFSITLPLYENAQ